MNDKKVLIVDFDTESLIALSNLVYEEGFQAETATDGLTAYEKFRSGHFDLVILEPMLPKLHGFELCKRIVNDPERKVPVIIVTAIYREGQCRQEALTVNGASAFFTKPYDRDELRSKMLQLLVEGHGRAERPVEAPAAAAVAPPRTPSPAAPAHARTQSLDLMDLLEKAPAPKGVRTAKPAIDIEKELQEAVSGLVGPAKKKDGPVRKEPDVLAVKNEFRQLREKREARSSPEERDIDRLLKDAIGGLGAPAKKPVEPATREPVFKPVPSAKPDSRTHPAEKIPVAEEIKHRLPFQPGKPNNVPHAASPAEVSRTAVPFDIDRTLIEIDQIPIDDIKPARDKEKGIRPVPQEAKGTMFQEFEEPAGRKPRTAIIAAVGGLLIVAASAGFLVLKPKTHEQPAAVTAAMEQTSGTETVPRPPEAKSYPDMPGAELKAEPRKPVKSMTEKPVEIGAPIEPSTSIQGALVELRDQPAAQPPDANATTAGTGLPAPTEVVTPPDPEPAAQRDAQESAAAPGPAPAGEPAPSRALPGELVDLGQVNVAPILIKRVEPKYPPIALRSGTAGTVTVNALISETGDVLRTEILKGIKDDLGLEDAAEAAIRQWKFRPARKDGVNVRVWKAFDITFANPKKS